MGSEVPGTPGRAADVGDEDVAVNGVVVPGSAAADGRGASAVDDAAVDDAIVVAVTPFCAPAGKGGGG